jgi:hypothetical protein
MRGYALCSGTTQALPLPARRAAPAVAGAAAASPPALSAAPPAAVQVAAATVTLRSISGAFAQPLLIAIYGTHAMLMQ